MRQSHSNNKQIIRPNRYQYKSPQNIRSQLNKKYPPFSKIDSENIKTFYLQSMIKTYQQNKSTHPNPENIVNSICLTEKKVLELQKQLMYAQDMHKFYQARKNYKSEARTIQTLQGSDQTRSEKSINKNFQEEYINLKLKFISLFEKYLKNSQSYIKLTSAQSQKVPEVLIQCIKNIINNFLRQRILIEEKFTQKQRKKCQSLQQKYKREIQNQTEQCNKLKNKAEQLIDENRKYSQQLKNIEKQKNQLYSQISQKHQLLIQKSNQNQQLRRLLRIQSLKIQQSEKKSENIKKKILQQKQLLEDQQNVTFELENKLKQLKEQNQRLQKQSYFLKKKYEEQVLQKNMGKSRSSQNLVSLKIINDSQKNFDRNSNKQALKQLERQLTEKQIKIINLKNQLQQVRNISKNAIEQWKLKNQQTLEELQELDQNITARDQLIYALQVQLAQLKVQLKTRDKIHLEQLQHERNEKEVLEQKLLQLQRQRKSN